MSNTFVCADLHLGHAGIVKFLREDGSKVRPWESAEDMDEALIKNWNDVVRDQDKVYVLGDVVINRKALQTLKCLRGDKVLVKGNHDIFRLNEYTEVFRDIRAYHVMAKEKAILSHIPIHPQSLERWNVNVHGHLHTNIVTTVQQVLVNPGERGSHLEYVAIPDHRYLCVSMEHINYTPISWEDCKKRFEEQQ